MNFLALSVQPNNLEMRSNKVILQKKYFSLRKRCVQHTKNSFLKDLQIPFAVEMWQFVFQTWTAPRIPNLTIPLQEFHDLFTCWCGAFSSCFVGRPHCLTFCEDPHISDVVLSLGGLVKKNALLKKEVATNWESKDRIQMLKIWNEETL